MFCLNEYQNDELVLLAKWTREMTQTHGAQVNQSPSAKQHRSLTDTSGRKIRVEMIGRESLQISVSETVLELRQGAEVPSLTQEIAQFNRLMENIQLPVFVWHNRDLETLEIHWQESLNCSVEPSFLSQIKDQTSMIAHALRKKLAAWSKQDASLVLQ